MIAVFAGFMLLLFPLSYFIMQEIAFEDTVSILEGRFKKQELLEEDSERIKAIKLGFELLKSPKVLFVGTGPGNMMGAYVGYSSGVHRLHQGGVAYHRSGVHNVWIKMLVEYGMFAVVIYILVWLSMIRRVMYFNKQLAGDDATKAWARFMLAFLVPFLLLDTMIYESAMSYHELVPIFALLALLVTKTEGRAGATGYQNRAPVIKAADRNASLLAKANNRNLWSIFNGEYIAKS
jgi:hypothetical protein